MTRFDDEEPEAWERDWSDWSDSKAEVCDYCAGRGHGIRRCPVALEEDA